MRLTMLIDQSACMHEHLSVSNVHTLNYNVICILINVNLIQNNVIFNKKNVINNDMIQSLNVNHFTWCMYWHQPYFCMLRIIQIIHLKLYNDMLLFAEFLFDLTLTVLIMIWSWFKFSNVNLGSQYVLRWLWHYIDK